MEPEKAPQPTPPPPKPQPSKTFAMPDRSALKVQVDAPIEDTKASDEPVVASSSRNKAFTEEDLAGVWTEILTKKESEDRNQEVRIFQGGYRLKGHEIEVSITNEALLPTFEKVKFDLLNTLRNKFENDQITVLAKVVEVEKEKMRYTDSEKFEYLKEKYPALKDLQDKLGLDPEF